MLSMQIGYHMKSVLPDFSGNGAEPSGAFGGLGTSVMHQVKALDKTCLRFRFWQQLYSGDPHLNCSGLYVLKIGRSGLL